MVKNILFRADSSSLIGTGHIIRDLTYSSKYKNSNIIFAVRELDGNINYKIKEYGYKIEVLKSSRIEELINLIKKSKIHLLVIDNYNINYSQEKMIKEKTGVKILSFDDTYQKHYCDILLNHNISANKKRYKKLVPAHCQLLCGKKYTIIRDEFYKQKYKKYKKNNFKKIFIAMGGADHTNINIDILKTIKSLNIKKLIVNLVTTDANKNLNQLKLFCKNKNWINLQINSTNIAKLIKKSDLCIITPSVTANEVLFLNQPLLSIKTASNQTEIYNYLKKNKYPVLKKFDKKKFKDKLCKIL